jgi:hypothetical protein
LLLPDDEGCNQFFFNLDQVEATKIDSCPSHGSLIKVGDADIVYLLNSTQLRTREKKKKTEF